MDQRTDQKRVLSVELQRFLLEPDHAKKRVNLDVVSREQIAVDRIQLGDDLVFLCRDAKCILEDGLCDDVGHVDGVARSARVR